MLKVSVLSGLLIVGVYGIDFNSMLGKVVQQVSEPSATVSSSEYKIPGYDKELSLKMAALASGVFSSDFGKRAFTANGIVYDGYVDEKEGLVNLQFAYAHSGTLSSSMDIYIAIRGSKEMMDWATDANFLASTYDEKMDKKLEVHSGFLQSANLLIAQEQFADIAGTTLSKLIALNSSGKRRDRFFITGHSLGGAVATIYATKLIDRGIKKEKLVVYTFGAPPVSMDEGATKDSIKNASFMDAINGVVDSSFSSEKKTNYYIDKYSNKIDIYRIYDKNDLVPKLIAPAKHLGIPVQYGDDLEMKSYIDKDKMWKIHWMKNYKNQIKSKKPEDPML